MHFIKTIEKRLNKKAKIKFMDIARRCIENFVRYKFMEKLIGPRLKTNIDTGVNKFIDWYIEYYKIKKYVKK